MKIDEAPMAGWGILEPDPELTPDTLKLVEQLRVLPKGQCHALLTRAIPRYLYVELKLKTDKGEQPDKTQMVTCSSALSNLWLDIFNRLPR